MPKFLENTETPLPLEEHLRSILEQCSAPAPIHLPIQDAATRGLILAEDVHAKLNVPPFPNSAVDGYLCRRADLSELPCSLIVDGDIPAGAYLNEASEHSAPVPAAGHAYRIMTGAPAPANPAEFCVIPVEHTDQPRGPQPLPKQVEIRAFDPERPHIRATGDDTKVGALLCEKGSRLDAGALAALISTGVNEVAVYPRPRVAVVSSGDELVAPGVTPNPGQLPDSNGPMVATIVADYARSIEVLHVADSPEDLRDLLDELVQRVDLIITTGGVSAGAYDVVRMVGSTADIRFYPVAMQPGKPQGAGRWRGPDSAAEAQLLCLPGNPVAAFCSAYLFAVPTLEALAGANPSTEPYVAGTVPAIAEAPIPAPREGWARVVPLHVTVGNQLLVSPFAPGGRGSHRVASLSGVGALAVLARGSSQVEAGDTIPVRLLRLPQ